MVRITFDSNVWQRVVVPDRFPNDPSPSAIAVIRAALETRIASGFISETVATLEAIKKADRHAYFSEATAKITFDEQPSEGSTIRMRVTLGADNDKHLGLMPVLSDRLGLAISELGFKLLRAPRVGIARPQELLDASRFADDGDNDPMDRNERFAEVGRAIEATGRGFASAHLLAAAIESRVGSRSGFLWRDYLKLANDTEARRIAPVIAEWADGDAVASHVAYENDIFCTCDRAVGAGCSVLDAESRAALSTAYNVCFMNVEELAAYLDGLS